MDDRLGEALHVLRNHAVGAEGLVADLQSLSASVSGHAGAAAALGSISQAFGLVNRLQGLVSSPQPTCAYCCVLISALTMLDSSRWQTTATTLQVYPLFCKGFTAVTRLHPHPNPRDSPVSANLSV